MTTTYLRHAARHIQRTLTDHVGAWLDGLGWTGTNPPFGTSPVDLQLRRIRESEMQPISGNLVAINFGEEPDDEDAELGAGLLISRTTMYLDVVAVNEAIGLALASDIKDLLTARAPGTTRFMLVRDYTTTATGVAIPEYQIELVDVSRVRPDNSEIKAFWQALAAEVEVTFPGSP